VETFVVLYHLAEWFFLLQYFPLTDFTSACWESSLKQFLAQSMVAEFIS
jgi:hypothetical protein